ncbi:MAG: zinc-ribbon domain-containing protein [Deltaproteobacteria bacterium]
MIIECEKCKTKYSFDETLMKDDEIWLRCSKCNFVFFISHESTTNTVEHESLQKNTPLTDIEVAQRDSKKSFLLSWGIAVIIICVTILIGVVTSSPLLLQKIKNIISIQYHTGFVTDFQKTPASQEKSKE